MHSFHGLSSLPYGIHKTISIQFKKDFFQNLNVYCMHIFSFILFSSPVHFHKLFDASAPLFTPCINNNITCIQWVVPSTLSSQLLCKLRLMSSKPWQHLCVDLSCSLCWLACQAVTQYVFRNHLLILNELIISF